MKKLKYGLLLILTMILFSVPVLAAKTTYYLPSKIVMHGDTYLYSYDKYGHLIEYSVSGEYEDDEKTTWKYKYDKNGKRTTGERYLNGKLKSKLVFDKNDHLKTEKWISYGDTTKYKWNAKGYYEGDSVSSDAKYKYSYYNNGRIKKRATFINGELSDVAYFDKSGLRSKNPPESDGYRYTFEYVFDKNGLVKTQIITSKFVLGGVTTRTRVNYYYSKTKTDAKTYYQFIDGWDSCRNNGKL